MSYIKAEEHLPEELIREIQKYVQGAQIYIPGVAEQKLSWGEKNGTKQKLASRNNSIREMKGSGWKIDDLADHFNLSSDSIRKILYKRKAS